MRCSGRAPASYPPSHSAASAPAPRWSSQLSARGSFSTVKRDPLSEASAKPLLSSSQHLNMRVNTCVYTVISAFCQDERAALIRMPPNSPCFIATIYFLPVLPKPPSERSVPPNSSTASSSACGTEANTIGAILSPGSITKSSLPKFAKITRISPR